MGSGARRPAPSARSRPEGDRESDQPAKGNLLPPLQAIGGDLEVRQGRERRDGDLRLSSGKGGAQAEMDAAGEGEMQARIRPAEIE
jgi:hypothetical protein